MKDLPKLESLTFEDDAFMNADTMILQGKSRCVVMILDMASLKSIVFEGKNFQKVTDVVFASTILNRGISCLDLTAVEEIEISTFSFDKANSLSVISIIKWIS